MGKAKGNESASLRRRAEDRLDGLKKTTAKSAAGVGPVLGTDELRLLHELEVHQVELELQNEELRATRGAAEAALARYTELFDFAPIGYITLTCDETVRELNLVGAQLLGRERANVVGRSFWALIAPADRAEVASLVSRVMTSPDGEKEECFASLQAGGGQAFTAHITARAVPGGSRMVLVAFEDVSEDLARREQLRRAEEELRETDKRKDEFLATLSHELRNPLGPIRSSLYVIAQTPPDSEPSRAAHAVIERQVTHLTRLVDDLLDMTRISRGRVCLRREPLDLCALLARTVDDHKTTFAASGVTLEIRAEPCPMWIDGDAARLVQVLSNLFGNAKKFTPAGGHVVAELTRDGGRAVVRVRDTGVGISPTELSRIFKPFAQAPQTMDRTRGGLGLGLAMVKGFVELHGGTVSIASEGPRRGTEVTVLLPLVDAPSQRGPVAAPEAAAGRRVLIIDDNVDSADTLKLALSLSGHETEAAYDGPTGIALARSFHPEVVICDIGLPGMDGYEVARMFRADDALRGIYLIALSGYAHIEDRRRASAAGFDLHVAKPPSLEALGRFLDQAHTGGAPPAPPAKQEAPQAGT